jgi:hypothetical protein
LLPLCHDASISRSAQLKETRFQTLSVYRQQTSRGVQA